MQLQEHAPVTRPDLQTVYKNGLETETLPNGEAAATILAAGIGVAILGLLTTLVAVSNTLRTGLTFNAAVGPLSGETILPVVAWLLAWGALVLLWRGKSVPFRRVYTATLILIGLGLLGTFPPFYNLFGG